MELISLQDYFAHMTPESFFSLFLNVFILIILNSLLSKIYVKYGHSFSDRNILARTFIIISLTTMLVITIVKSSLALSLGLVGALSIVRFRTAIKEPEELAFLFLSIGIGLGLGASGRKVTVFVCLVVFFLIWWRENKGKKETYPNLSLILSKGISGKKKINFEDYISVAKDHCKRVDVFRLEETNDTFELSLYIECDSFDKVSSMYGKFKAVDSALNVLFIDNNSGKTL